jgi:hypothetical protein
LNGLADNQDEEAHPDTLAALSQNIGKMSKIHPRHLKTAIKYACAPKLHGKVPAKIPLNLIRPSQKERTIYGKQEKPMTSAYSAFTMPSLGYSSG